jgi:GTP cyclohydrolase IA
MPRGQIYDNSVQVTIQQYLKRRFPEITKEAVENTPQRWVNALNEMTEGYDQDPEKILGKQFDEATTGMVVDSDIPFYSLCEHHLLPFHGIASVGYIADKKVVGLSKIPRLVECFARRFQLQERMTDQIADALDKALSPKGVMVVLEATHTCSSARGISKENVMRTSAIRGVFEKPEVRAEFMSLIRRNGK